MKQATVEITRTVIVEYDRESALLDFCSSDHAAGGFATGGFGWWDSRLVEGSRKAKVLRRRKIKGAK